jgi:hypothetical protein
VTLREGPRLRRACPWGTPWPVPAEQILIDRRKHYERHKHWFYCRCARRGWNREGADSPAGKSDAKTGPGAEERSLRSRRRPESFRIEAVIDRTWNMPLDS